MRKGQKPSIGARIPHQWKDQIDEICQESGKSESEVVQEAIAQYLNITDAESVVSLAKRVAKLERQYQKLVKLV